MCAVYPLYKLYYTTSRVTLYRSPVQRHRHISRIAIVVVEFNAERATLLVGIIDDLCVRLRRCSPIL